MTFVQTVGSFVLMVAIGGFLYVIFGNYKLVLIEEKVKFLLV